MAGLANQHDIDVGAKTRIKNGQAEMIPGRACTLTSCGGVTAAFGVVSLGQIMVGLWPRACAPHQGKVESPEMLRFSAVHRNATREHGRAPGEPTT